MEGGGGHSNSAAGKIEEKNCSIGGLGQISTKKSVFLPITQWRK